MAKKVCIIGAGPSGLVAAKTLLHDVPKGTFDVTIFEAETRIGGLWPLDRDEEDGMIHPDMVANQSKHTVQFSDLAWEDTDPEFPYAWQVGRYLQRYQERYLQDAKLRLGIRVKSAEPVRLSQGDGYRDQWKVQTGSHHSEVELEIFDYVLVASGYFGSPVFRPNEAKPFELPIHHSCQYRDLHRLLYKPIPRSKDGTELPPPPGPQGTKILVVGGQMSGVETAATIATHLSSAVHSPGPSPIPDPKKYTVHHLVQRPTWVFPTYTSPKPALAAPPFLPLDLVSYNVANRPQPLVNSQGHISVGSAKTLHSIFMNVLGTDQSEYSPDTAITGDDFRNPPYLAVSDTYLEHVRSGLITISRGHFEFADGHEISASSPDQLIPDVAALVFATGFEADPSIDFLPEKVQATLSISQDMENTVALAFHGTHHPEVPNLGFVGFYRSPYWGVMEMQARFLTALWDAGGPKSFSLPPGISAALEEDTSIERAIDLRTDPRSAQFPMGDYPWLMQEFASALWMERFPHSRPMPKLPPAGDEMDILTPARYPSKNLSEEQRAEVMKSLKQTEDTVWAGLTSGKFVAKAVFRSLAGKWKVERTLTSRLPSHPSGRFTGTVEFRLRDQTREGRTVEYDKIHRAGEKQGMEYLYVEKGFFEADNNIKFETSRKYVWRYNEEKDTISVWFVDVGKTKTVDYFFHDIIFTVPEPDADKDPNYSWCGWKATAGHLCIQDYYDVDYTFNFNAVNIRDWKLKYDVKGPQKDYTIDGSYTRFTDPA